MKTTDFSPYVSTKVEFKPITEVEFKPNVSGYFVHQMNYVGATVLTELTLLSVNR